MNVVSLKRYRNKVIYRLDMWDRAFLKARSPRGFPSR